MQTLGLLADNNSHGSSGKLGRKFTRVSSVVTIDLVVEHGVEQDAEAELAARTIGLQRQLGLEVHVEGETSEHLSHSQGYPGLQSLICSSDLLFVGGDGVWGPKQLVVEAAVLPVDEAACEPARHARLLYGLGQSVTEFIALLIVNVFDQTKIVDLPCL